MKNLKVTKENVSNLNDVELSKLLVEGTLSGEPGQYYNFKRDTQGRVLASFRYKALTPSGMGKSSQGNYMTHTNVKFN